MSSINQKVSMDENINGVYRDVLLNRQQENDNSETKEMIHVNTKKCYTCNPRGKAVEHIITSMALLTFHHDFWKRPCIIATPNFHYHNVEEIPAGDLHEMFREIRAFMNFWKMGDFEISINTGKWQKHHHFHFKVRGNELKIDSIRRDHLRLVELQKTYKKMTNTRQDTQHLYSPYQLMSSELNIQR